ncbi:MAG: flagellar biosynthesis protein FlhF [Phycisphaerales bacterium]|jgi:flagellar biosynthesis protein FlhF
MGIRTYRARSMADAIDAVQRELGRDAIILHTRNYKVGGLFGIGGRPVVEVTASPASVVRDRQRGKAPRQTGVRSPQPASPPKQPARPRPRRELAEAADPTSPQRRQELLERYTQLAGAPSPAPQPNASPEAPPFEVAAAPVKADSSAPSERVERMRVRASGANTPAAPAGVESELRSLRNMLGRMMHTQQAGPVSAAALGEPLAGAYVRMVEAEVDRDLADEVVSVVRAGLTREELCDASLVGPAVQGALADVVRVASPGRGRTEGGPLTIALVGPTGVGKTTTIAKLAAAYKLRRGRRVGLITTDTFRIAAVEQLRTYASIISVPLRVVMSPAEMAAACRAMSDCDVVLIDTAGRSPRDDQRVDELSEYLAAAKPDETHLVLAATAGAGALRRAAEGFAKAGPDRVLFTKLDEAEGVGTVISMVHALGLPLSFVTTGQEVPDHIEPGRADRLARLVLVGGVPARRPEPRAPETNLPESALTEVGA